MDDVAQRTEPPANKPRGRGRPPLVGRRDEILDAAVHIMAERGVEALSMNQLAEAMGFSSYALTYHFGSRDDVLAAVAEHVETRMQNEFRALAAAGGDLGTLVRRYWDSVHGSATRAATARVFFEFTLLASRSPQRFPDFVDRAVFGWQRAIGATLGERDDADDLATLTLGTVVGLELLRMVRPEEPIPTQVLEPLIDSVGPRRARHQPAS